MFDMNLALNLFRDMCQKIISDCEKAQSSDDVQDAFEDYCEVEGMVKLLTRSCQMSLNALSVLCGRAYHEAWKAWCKANDRINYDPITGEQRRV